MNTKLFDLYAPIIPKQSAAGLQIGITTYDQVVSQTSDPNFRLEYSGYGCTKYINVNFKEKWVLMLMFNAKGILFCIFMYEGYKGLFLDKIGIGSDVSELNPYFAIEYDDGDELYYPLRHGTFDPLYEAVDTRIFEENHEYFGIGFSILEEEQEDNWWDDNPIYEVQGIIQSITVQNWSLQS